MKRRVLRSFNHLIGLQYLQPVTSSIFSNVALLFLLTLSFASCMTCQICSALVSPRDRREQNSPSVVVPENGNAFPLHPCIITT